MEAFDHSRLEVTDPARAGALFATGVGGISTMIDQLAVLHSRGADRVSPFFVPMLMPNAGAAAVSLALRAARPVPDRDDRVRRGHPRGHRRGAPHRAQGRCDVMLTGGGEYAMADIAVAGFRNMTALSKTGVSRPVRRRARRVRPRRGRRRPRARGARPRDGPRRHDLRGDPRRREHRRRPPHHRPGPRVDGRDHLHPPRARRRGHRAGRRRARERARDLDAAQRPRRGAGAPRRLRRRTSRP